MVNYNLGIKRKIDRTHNLIDLSSSILSSNPKDLKQIDNFTMAFESEEQLLQVLVQARMLPRGIHSGNLSIVYKESKTLPVLYQDSRYIMEDLYNLSSDIIRYELIRDDNYTYIMGYFSTLKKYIQNIRLISELANYYNHVPTQTLNTNDIFLYLNELNSNKEIPRYVYIALYELLKTAMLKKDKEDNLVINYRGLRDLTVILNRHNNIKKLSNIKEKLQKEYSGVQLIMDGIKLPVLEGTQLDMFTDAAEVSVINGSDEPLFPPNSEEERKYLEYIDSIMEKEEEHIHKK